jgi:hypothetical protein
MRLHEIGPSNEEDYYKGIEDERKKEAEIVKFFETIGVYIVNKQENPNKTPQYDIHYDSDLNEVGVKIDDFEIEMSQLIQIQQKFNCKNLKIGATDAPQLGINLVWNIN